MNTKEKISLFFKEKELNNKEVCAIMDGYSEQLFSRQINQEEISPNLIVKLKKFFPEIDLNFILSDHTVESFNEAQVEYKKKSTILIEEIEQRLKELKKVSRI